MRTCPLYYKRIKDYCLENKIVPLVTVNHYLLYKNSIGHFICHYHKVNGQYVFESSIKVNKEYATKFMKSLLN